MKFIKNNFKYKCECGVKPFLYELKIQKGERKWGVKSLS